MRIHPHIDADHAAGDQAGETPGSVIHLTSVGVDVGSATTQVLISELVLESRGSLVSSGYEIVERHVRYRSPLAFTTYAGDRRIDESGVRDVVASAYRTAGVAPADVDTGALIVTGDAARSDNAEAVAAAIAGMAGTFVCIAAGPHLEARLAAHGAGAVDASRAEPDVVLLHVDVGGGTTKVSVIRDGTILESAAVNVGGRMLVLDEDGRVRRVTPALRRLADHLGLDLQPGRQLDPAARAAVTDALATDLLGFIRGEARPPDEVVDEPVTAPLRHRGAIGAVLCSGGVSAYMDGSEPRDFGDLGPWLGPAVMSRLRELGAPVRVATDGIRATVLGAGQFTTQVSGMTTQHRPDRLPVRGLRVVPLSLPDGALTAGGVTELARRAFRAVDLEPGARPALLSVTWSGVPSYRRVRPFADGIRALLLESPAAIGLAFDHDLAQTVGRMADPDGDLTLLVIDEVRLGHFDVVDVGAPVSDPPVLPVTVRRIATA